MTHTYQIEGMTCNGCVAKVKSELLKLGEVTAAEVQLASPQATITMQNHVSEAALQQAISKTGNYKIRMESHPPANKMADEINKTWYQTYKPLLLIFAFITAISLLTSSTVEHWMNNFMAGFFITFSFFKLLDLKGFADSYSTYDLLAKKWYAYGYIYPFIELALGIAYLTNAHAFYTNLATVIVMGFSSIGVIQSVLTKRKIQCACLGAVFNLPMSTVTIIEDLLMVAMAAFMLLAM
jgi:copper chaperone CopZ